MSLRGETRSYNLQGVITVMIKLQSDAPTLGRRCVSLNALSQQDGQAQRQHNPEDDCTGDARPETGPGGTGDLAAFAGCAETRHQVEDEAGKNSHVEGRFLFQKEQK